MKIGKLLLAAIFAVMTLNVRAAPAPDVENNEEEQLNFWHVRAIAPYVGIISGVDVQLRDLYLGIGTNFMTSENTAKPRYVVHDAPGDRWWNYSPTIETKTEELFHLSAGIAREKFSAGLHTAIGQVKPTTSGFDSATTFGFGVEAAYYPWDNLFIKGSITYFLGADEFGYYSFYDSGMVSGFVPNQTLTYNTGDKVSIGAAWMFGLAVGYRFSL